jgi:hypothetical protein
VNRLRVLLFDWSFTVGLIFAVASVVSFRVFFDFLPPGQEPHLYIKVLAVANAFAMSVALFKMREHEPRGYAVLEIIAGLIAAWLAFSGIPNKDGAVRALQYAAAVYLMIRGWDNWHRKPPPLDEPKP